MSNMYQGDSESHMHYLISATPDRVIRAAEFTHIMWAWCSEEMHYVIPKFLTFLLRIRLTLSKAPFQKREPVLKLAMKP